MKGHQRWHEMTFQLKLLSLDLITANNRPNSWWLGDLNMGKKSESPFIPKTKVISNHYQSFSTVWVHPKSAHQWWLDTIGCFGKILEFPDFRKENTVSKVQIMCNEKAPNLLKTQSCWKPRWVPHWNMTQFASPVSLSSLKLTDSWYLKIDLNAPIDGNCIFQSNNFHGGKALSFRESSAWCSFFVSTASPGRPSKVSVTEEVDHLVALQNTAKWRIFFLDEMVGVSKLVKQNWVGRCESVDLLVVFFLLVNAFFFGFLSVKCIFFSTLGDSMFLSLKTRFSWLILKIEIPRFHIGSSAAGDVSFRSGFYLSYTLGSNFPK